MTTLPDLSAQLVDGNGKIKSAWQGFFRQLVTSQTRANGNIASITTEKASAQQSFSEAIFIEFPTDKDFVFAAMDIDGTIDSVVTEMSSGTCTVMVLAGGQPLGGGTNSGSSIRTTVMHTANNELQAGDDVTIRISASSSPVGLSVTLRGLRTLS